MVSAQQIAWVTAAVVVVGDNSDRLILGLVAPSSEASRTKTEVSDNAPECAE